MREKLDVKNLEPENPAVPVREPTPPDAVDDKLAVWLEEVPELDAATEGIVERIGLIERTIRRTHDETLEQFGLSWGEVKVMGSLRYGGRPYRSTPGRLAAELDLSSGAMTARLDKMEAAGLIRRLPDPDDRRGVIVELTDEGRDLWQRSVEAQAEKETAVAAELNDEEKAELNDLLRRMLHSLAEAHGPLHRKHKRS